MCGVWLAITLAGLTANAAGTQVANGPPIAGGADKSNVLFVLGRPTHTEIVGVAATDAWMWRRVDWLGTVRTRRIAFDKGGVVQTDEAECELFAVTRRWLEAIQKAFHPRPGRPAPGIGVSRR